MEMTLKALVQEFCKRTGVEVPNAPSSSTDPQIIQIIALLNEQVEEVTSLDFQELLQEKTFLANGLEDQGLINTVIGAPVRSILNNIIWDRTGNIPVIGQVTPQIWQQWKAQVGNGGLSQYRIRGDKLLFNPPITAGHTCALEYYPQYTVQVEADDTYKLFFTLDDDYTKLPDRVMMAGIRWRWKREKGLAYSEDKARYNDLLMDHLGRSGTKATLNMGGDCNPGVRVGPGVFVPSGSWNV